MYIVSVYDVSHYLEYAQKVRHTNGEVKTVGGNVRNNMLFLRLQVSIALLAKTAVWRDVKPC